MYTCIYIHAHCAYPIQMLIYEHAGNGHTLIAKLTEFDTLQHAYAQSAY